MKMGWYVQYTTYVIHISHTTFGGGSTAFGGGSTAFGGVPTALHFTLIVFMAT